MDYAVTCSRTTSLDGIERLTARTDPVGNGFVRCSASSRVFPDAHSALIGSIVQGIAQILSKMGPERDRNL